MNYKNYFKKRLFENMMVNPENMPAPSAEYGAVLAQPTYQNPVSTEEQPPLPPFQIPPFGEAMPQPPGQYGPPTPKEIQEYREALRNYNINYTNWLRNFIRWLSEHPGHFFDHTTIPSSFPIPEPPKEPLNTYNTWKKAKDAWIEWIRRYYEMP